MVCSLALSTINGSSCVAATPAYRWLVKGLNDGKPAKYNRILPLSIG